MFRSKGISHASSVVDKSENDQGCEYDIYESRECSEH
jgi:hypothetical protein